MKILKDEFGRLTIEDDENVMDKIEGLDLDEVKIDGRITADELANAYEKASRRHDVIFCAKYAKLKEEYIRIFG